MPALQAASVYNRQPVSAPSNQTGTFWYRVEKIAVIISLLMFSEALLGRLFASETNLEGGAFLRYLWLPFYGYAALAMALRWRDLLTIALRSPALVALAVLAMMSMAWSIDPGTSLRRGIAILFTTMFGFYVASRYSWPELMRILGVVWIILAVGNLIAGAVTPSFGIMDEIHVGAWKGLWFEKNAMGGHLARASFLFLCLAVFDPANRRWWVFGALASVVLVLLSTSKTSLLGMMLGGMLLCTYLVMQRGKIIAVSLVWLATASVAILFMMLLVAPDVLAELIGRDLTLTGRTDIWAVLFTLMEERPWLGYGYGTFWGEDSRPAYIVRLETEWEVPTAHNGIIEVMLALGRVGAILFIIDFAMNLSRSILNAPNSRGSFYALGYFVLFALFSISESVVLQQNSINWLAYAALAARLSLDARSRSERSDRPLNRISRPRITPIRRLPTRSTLRGRTGR